MLTKKDYINQYRSPSATDHTRLLFLQSWCREENRPFESLFKIIQVMPNAPEMMTDYFDKKYKITILVDKDGTYILPILKT